MGKNGDALGSHGFAFPKLGVGLRKIKNQILVESATTPRKKVKTEQEKKRRGRDTIRARSDINEQIVAQVRWLYEHKGWKPCHLREKFGLSQSRMGSIIYYKTWCDIDPSPEGLDES